MAKASKMCRKYKLTALRINDGNTAVLYSPSPVGRSRYTRLLVLSPFPCSPLFLCLFPRHLSCYFSRFSSLLCYQVRQALCYTFSPAFCPGFLDLSRSLSRRKSLKPCFLEVKFTLLSFVVIGITRSQNKCVCLKF